MDKKAAELTMNVIIIAVLALIVLAVLLFMFSSKMRAVDSGLKSCSALGGSCTGTVDEMDKGKVSKVTCAKGAPILNTDCGDMRGCCIDFS